MARADDTPGKSGDQGAEGSVKSESTADQEKREASELLAGFDRPGRNPRRSAPGAQDFVDYYASGAKPPSRRRGMAGAGSAHGPENDAPTVERPAGMAPLPPMRAESPTYILPREERQRARRRMAGWAGWLTAAGLLVLVGTGVAFLATMDDGAGGTARGTSPVPSAATTITSGASGSAAPPRDDIPPPEPTGSGVIVVSEPASTAVVTAPETVPSARPTASVKRGAPSAAAASASSTASPATTTVAPNPPRRDDLIREMH